MVCALKQDIREEVFDDWRGAEEHADPTSKKKSENTIYDEGELNTFCMKLKKSFSLIK